MVGRRGAGLGVGAGAPETAPLWEPGSDLTIEYRLQDQTLERKPVIVPERLNTAWCGVGGDRGLK